MTRRLSPEVLIPDLGAKPAWADAAGVRLMQIILPQMAAHGLATAPPGADVTSRRS